MAILVPVSIYIIACMDSMRPAGINKMFSVGLLVQWCVVWLAATNRWHAMVLFHYTANMAIAPSGRAASSSIPFAIWFA